MKPPKPDLVVLPFTAVIAGTSIHLTLEHALSMLKRVDGARVRIERSYPGAPHAIGWTIFRRTPRKYVMKTNHSFASNAARVAREAFAKPMPFTIR